MGGFGETSTTDFFIINVGAGKKVPVRVKHAVILTELTYVYSDRSSDAVIVYGDASENSCAGTTVAPPSRFDPWNS
jgi:hypothetical protein